MKKYFLSTSFIAIFVLYIFFYRPAANSGLTPMVFKPSQVIPTRLGEEEDEFEDDGVIPQPAPIAQTRQTATVATANYKDGSYVGDPADAFYGTIQVKAVVANKKLADVTFLSFPNDRNNSIRVNTYAMPILKSEAITAQSDQVDTVSGATFTSKAFRLSLASALDKAKP